MGVKRTLDYDQLVVDGDMSSNITSASTNILNLDRVGYQLSWSGTPTGDFTVEISNDETNWIEMTLSATISAAGSADTAFIDCETAAKFIRLVYTSSSGSGTLQVKITGKSISG
jgi:hypothetical protein